MKQRSTGFSHIMTSSNGNIFRVTGPLWGESTGRWWILSQRPVTRSFYVFFDLHLNKRLNKHLIRRWFETSSRSLWRYCHEWSRVMHYAIIGSDNGLSQGFNQATFLISACLWLIAPQISVKFESKYHHCLTKRWTWKCSLQKGDHFVSVSMGQMEDTISMGWCRST